MSKPKNYTAFPGHFINAKTGKVSQGMSLRDYFAAKAMQAAISPDGIAAISKANREKIVTIDESCNSLAMIAYYIADTMLEVRSK